MPGQFESDLLRTFVAIIDTGSFTLAARQIGRTQSAVSMQMKRLEELAGTPLLLRGDGAVRPSEAGEKLLVDARPILAHLERVRANFDRQPIDGTVRIGILAEYGATFLPRILGRFAESNPKVEVTVKCAHSGILYDALERDELDLAVVLDRPGQKGGTILMRDRTFWATSKHHKAHKLDVLPVALFDPGCWWRDWALDTLRRMKRPYRTAYTSDNNFNLKAAVSAGLAVGALTDSMLPADCRPLLPADGFPEPINSNVTLRKRASATSKAVSAMADAIKSEVGHLKAGTQSQ